jgi:predicted RNA-binding Zn ribbon-like protein
VGWTFDRTAGHLALDFANTVSNRRTPPAIERLASYGDLAEFARQTGLVSAAEAKRLARVGEQRPEAAAGVLAEAVALREALYRIFESVATDATPRAGDVAVLNAHHARFRLDERFHWEWSARPDGLDAFLGPVVRAAIDLLTSERRDRVRRCADDTCLWIFFDTSKNRSRRWCDMAQCGNRAKARRFHERHQPDG